MGWVLMGSNGSLPGASTPARLRAVLQNRAGKVPGVLHHRVNLWPGQEARTQRFIPDALGQPLDDPRCLTEGGARLPLFSPGLIHPSQRRLDLPLLCRPADLCGQLGGLAQGIDRTALKTPTLSW